MSNFLLYREALSLIKRTTTTYKLRCLGPSSSRKILHGTSISTAFFAVPTTCSTLLRFHLVLRALSSNFTVLPDGLRPCFLVARDLPTIRWMNIHVCEARLQRSPIYYTRVPAAPSRDEGRSSLPRIHSGYFGFITQEASAWMTTFHISSVASGLAVFTTCLFKTPDDVQALPSNLDYFDRK